MYASIADSVHQRQSGSAAESGFWQTGSYQELQSARDGAKWDGRVSGVVVGADRVRGWGKLVGVGLSRQQADIELGDGESGGGGEVDLVSVSPYMAWRRNQLNYRSSVSIGSGSHQTSDQAERKLTTLGLGFGASGGLWRPSWGEVDLDTEVLYSTSAVQQNSGDTQRLATGQGRFGLRTRRENALDTGKPMTTSSGLRLRGDFGDGSTGIGLEAEVGMNYRNGLLELDAELYGLAMHSDHADEWGARFQMRVNPGLARRELSLRFSGAKTQILLEGSLSF